MTIGKRIALLRKEKQLSQSELAKFINVAPSTIGMWETDQRAIKDDSLKQLADFFEVSADYLLGTKEKDATGKISHNAEVLATHLDDTIAEDDFKDILNYIEFRKNNPLNK